MGHYLDTSFLAPYLIPEPASEMVDGTLQKLPAGSLVISHWTRTEFASLLARQVRTGTMSKQTAAKVFEALDRIIRDGLIRVEGIEGEDYRQAASWLMTGTAPMRGPGALHLGIVHRLGATLWTLDKKMAEAAHVFGLDVGEPGVSIP